MHKTFQLEILQMVRVFISPICTLLSEKFLYRTENKSILIDLNFTKTFAQKRIDINRIVFSFRALSKV